MLGNLYSSDRDIIRVTVPDDTVLAEVGDELCDITAEPDETHRHTHHDS